MSAKKVAPKVYEILKQYPETRSDDRLLMDIFYETYYKLATCPLYRVFELQREGRVPTFESVRRARQKLQETNEDLRGTKESEDARMAMQEEYLEFAREDVRI